MTLTTKRAAGRLVSVSSPLLVTMTELERFLRTIIIAQTEVVTLARLKALSKVIAIISAQLVTLRRSIARIVVISTALDISGTALARQALRAVGTGIAQVVTLNRLSSISKTIAVAIADLKTLARQTISGQVTNPLTLIFATADVKTLLRRLPRTVTVTVTSPDLKTLSRNVAKTFAVQTGDLKI